MQLGATLKEVFGGEPGWLARIPVDAFFDLQAGRAEGPGWVFVQNPVSRRWTYAPQIVPSVATPGPAS